MKKITALIMTLVLILTVSLAVVYAADDPDPNVVTPITEKL